MTLLIAFLAKCFLNLEISDESVLVRGNSSIIGFWVRVCINLSLSLNSNGGVCSLDRELHFRVKLIPKLIVFSLVEENSWLLKEERGKQMGPSFHTRHQTMLVMRCELIARDWNREANTFAASNF